MDVAVVVSVGLVVAFWILMVGLMTLAVIWLTEDDGYPDIYSPDLDRDLVESLDCKASRLIEMLEAERVELAGLKDRLAALEADAWGPDDDDDDFDDDWSEEDEDDCLDEDDDWLDEEELELGGRLNGMEDRLKALEEKVTGYLQPNPPPLLQYSIPTSWYEASTAGPVDSLLDAVKVDRIGEAMLKDGWQTGDAADFLGMTEGERQELDRRMEKQPDGVLVSMDGPLPNSLPLRTTDLEWEAYCQMVDADRKAEDFNPHPQPKVSTGGVNE